ncbi:MAG: RNA-binding protein S4 [Rhodospirillaceae bacterium]|nr:RNA-binding protein S4 [Rhodospirillaceae bacterium]
MSSAVKTRLDKWLWYARFFKSRTLAAKQINAGKIRINRKLARKARAPVQSGDVLTFAQGSHIRVIKVVALGERRGPAIEARKLYKDLEPHESTNSNPKLPSAAARDTGTGRPTKKQRRAIDRLKGWFGIEWK